jgi:hypothetical protein
LKEIKSEIKFCTLSVEDSTKEVKVRAAQPSYSKMVGYTYLFDNTKTLEDLKKPSRLFL